MSEPSAEAKLLEAAAQVLRLRCAPASLRGVSLLGTLPGGHEVQVAVKSEAPRPARKTLRACVREALRAADRPLKGPALARRCGRRYDSHFRATLAAMARDGEASHSGGGYLRAPDRAG